MKVKTTKKALRKQAELQRKQIKEQKKQAILSYLEFAPIYKYAAKAVGIDKDTLQAWREKDKVFGRQCEERMAEFVKTNIKKTKPEWQLERLFRDDFSERKEITGANGREMPSPILGGISLVSYLDGKPLPIMGGLSAGNQDKENSPSQ